MRLGILTFILLLLSCSRYPSEVESALQQAGGNRDSLVAVLEHYRDGDPLKYEAACFLIANMPYHGSSHRLEVPVQYGAYFAQVDSILETNADAVRDNDLKHELAVQYGRLPNVQTLGCKYTLAMHETASSQATPTSCFFTTGSDGSCIRLSIRWQITSTYRVCRVAQCTCCATLVQEKRNCRFSISMASKCS